VRRELGREDALSKSVRCDPKVIAQPDQIAIRRNGNYNVAIETLGWPGKSERQGKKPAVRGSNCIQLEG
jgi:hypothetical protein